MRGLVPRVGPPLVTPNGFKSSLADHAGWFVLVCLFDTDAPVARSG